MYAPTVYPHVCLPVNCAKVEYMATIYISNGKDQTVVLIVVVLAYSA